MTSTDSLPRNPTTIPAYRYISSQFAELELARMWPKVWQLACSTTHLPNPGDYYTYSLGKLSVLIVHSEDGQLRAFQNVCRHRGNVLCSGSGQGLEEIRCAYHRWCWTLEGELREVPSRKGFGALRNDDLPLFPVSVDTWGPLVFINLDIDCEPLSDWLEVIPELCEWADFDSYVCAYDLSVPLPCNWKTLIEAFSETYHVQGVHREMLASTDDVNSVNRLYGRHGSLYQPYGIPSPRLRGDVRPQDIWDSIVVTQGARYGQNSQEPGECPEIPPGASMRQVLAGLVLERAEREGWDASGFTESQLLDLFQFNLFPNTSVILMCDSATVLRARPGNTPDEASLDLLHFDRRKSGKLNGALSGALTRKTAGESGTTQAEKRPVAYPVIAALDPDNASLNLVFDQDVENLKRAQLGLHQPSFENLVLSREEMRIINLHHHLEDYLGIAPSEISPGSLEEIQELRVAGRAEMEPTGYNAPW